MNMLKTCSWRWIAVPLCLGLAACSSGSKPKPAKLADISPKITIQTAWTADVGRSPRIGAGQGAFSPAVSEGLVVSANRQGVVHGIEKASGRVVWRTDLKGQLAAGVGTGGGSGEGSFAVVTVGGDLVLLDAKGEVRWRVPMGGVGLEKPVISGGHVVVRLADNRVAGWDLATGNRRWVFQRTLPTLVLHGQSGLRSLPTADEASAAELMGPGDLLVGLPGGRLVWASGTNGAIRWESQFVTPRGSNEVERISDILGAPILQSDRICVAAYQTQVGCVSAETGRPIWQKRFDAVLPAAVGSGLLIAADSSDRIQAFDLQSGDLLWRQEGLFLRDVTGLAVDPRAAWAVDADGHLHAMSLTTGEFIGRIRLDGPLAGPIRLGKDGLLVQTASGRLSLLRP
jgi:outer membrane protein assembly factor BamB